MATTQQNEGDQVELELMDEPAKAEVVEGEAVNESMKHEDHPDMVYEDDDGDDDLQQIDDSEKWTSRMSFILAAIGSAIGLGNFWRFPFLAYRWGGGAFFIPYWIALFIVGIPLMQLEMTIGQVFRRASCQALGALDPRLRGIGLGAGWISFMVVCYYAGILAWGNVMLIRSCWTPMPWDISQLNGTDVVTVPANHFYNDVLHYQSDWSQAETISTALYTGLLFMWVCIYFILINGQEFISKAVWITVLLPVVMLFILFFVGVSLPGADLGVKAYIGRWDMSLLNDGQMWNDAFGQIFFSLGVGFGVMSAYASINPPNSNIVKDAAIISLCNCAFSFVAGFAVFTIVGFFAYESGYESIEDFAKPTDEGGLGASVGGSGLAFITYPAGLSLIGGVGAQVLCFFFFVTFFFLGIDSAFSLVEATVLNMREVALFSSYSRKELVSMVCVIGSYIGVYYITDVGANLIDSVDAYAATWGLVFVGFLESVAAGWVYHKAATVEKVGLPAVIVFDCGYFLAVFLLAVLSLTMEENGLAAGLGAGIGIWAVTAIVGVLLGAGRAGGVKESLDALAIGGTRHLRNRLNRVITKDAPGNWKLGPIWMFNLKFVITGMLFFLNMQQLISIIKSSGVLNPGTEGHPLNNVAVQVLSSLTFLVIVIFVLIGVAAPSLYRDPYVKKGVESE